MGNTLAGDWAGSGQKGQCQSGSRYCIGPISSGWAVQGFQDDVEALPLSLSINPSQREPDIAEHEQPNQITGTLTVEGLSAGDTYDFEDPKTFSSYSATYYRCVQSITT